MERLKILQENRIGKSLYNFKDTIERHTQGKLFAIEVIEERNRLGDIIATTKETPIKVGAILSLSKEELSLDLAGLYNHDTRKLYCSVKLKKGDRIRNIMNNGEVKEYKIIRLQDKSDYDKGLYIYYLERTDLS